MDIMNIVYAVLVLGIMGIVFGLALTFVSKKFAVEANPNRDAIREVLPGANCGGCGFPGCDACAEAMASGKSPVNSCPVGGAEVAAKVAKIMGVEVDANAEKKVATLVCQGDTEHCGNKFEYSGIHDCVAATLVGGDGYKTCRFACLGLGTCVRACPFDAIHIDETRHVAVVDKEKCQSCGKCVAACPKQALQLQPVEKPVAILCRNTDKLKAVMDVCKIGCIGCGKCEKACKFGAITMVNNLPVIDRTKCQGCMMCAEACPTKAMWGNFPERKKAKIDQASCVGCNMCTKNCQFNAIKGELREKHEILDACTGCGICATKCPKKCITLETRDHARDPKATAPVAPAPEAPAAQTK